MPDFSVHQYGVDPNGRAILMTAYMHQWLQGVIADLGFTPTIVQGAFMSRIPGGGASESAGYHDLGGCIDFRIWDLPGNRPEQLVRVLREHGAAAWRRDQSHGGMDPHCHIVLGTDRPLAKGAGLQWLDYKDGLDGLASNGPDYEWRPDPLVLTPPEDHVTPDDIEKVAQRTVELLLSAKVGNDDTTLKQVLNKVKTWLSRQ